MKGMKAIAILIVILMALTMLIGCTEPVTDGNAPKVTNQEEASTALNDASTDLSGVKQTLDDIENDLTE